MEGISALKSYLRSLIIVTLFIHKERRICIDLINKGDREGATITLKIINLTLKNLKGIGYEDLKDFYERETKVFPYVENKNRLVLRNKIVNMMECYAKSEEEVPSELLKSTCNHYFKELSVKKEERRKAINGLIVLCMDSCSKEQLKKLDNTVDVLCNI